MKNIEKYKETDAALKAWKKYRSGKSICSRFSDWLDEEYAEREPTLIEAAEDFLHAVQWDTANVSDRALDLGKAIVREKSKPVRNCDRYATAEEAYRAFMEMCSAKGCVDCRFGDCESINECRFRWLYAEADAGKDGGAK